MKHILSLRNEIYGFLALWILFFHVESRVGMDISIPILTSFVKIGNFSVDVFLFLSGFCLCLSLKRDDNVLQFYTKRFKRVVVTYLIIAVPFFIWKSLEEVSSMPITHFFYDLSGLSFWFSGCQNAWFVEAILLFYMITPPIFRIVKKGKVTIILLLLSVYVLNFIAQRYIPLYQKSAIAWTRLPVFVLGIIMACYWPEFDLKYKRLSTGVFVILGILFLLRVHSHLSGFFFWMLYAVMVLPVLYILSAVFSISSSSVRAVFAKLGKVSLEIYLVHIMALHIFTFYALNKQVGQWMYLLLPAIALPVSLLVPKASSYILHVIETK